MGVSPYVAQEESAPRLDTEWTTGERDARSSGMTVYDKAKWHFEAVLELGRDVEYAYAPAAYFFAWAAENGLLSEERTRQLAGDVEKFKRREVDGVFLFKLLDGTLDSADLSDEGNLFAMSYLDYRSGFYLTDLRSLFPPDVSQELTLGWRWEVYDQLAPVITKRREQWRSGALPDAL